MAEQDSLKTAPQSLHSVQMVADIVTAYVGRNHVMVADLPALITEVHKAVANVSGGGAEASDAKPAVSIKKSIGNDYLICLEDGKKLRMLKRYLRTQYGLSPEEYRAKWGLPADYPMIAPSYAALRSEFAKRNGLGRRSTKGARNRARA